MRFSHRLPFGISLLGLVLTNNWATAQSPVDLPRFEVEGRSVAVAEIPGAADGFTTESLAPTRFATPTDLLSGRPGLLALPAFDGGADHPRITLRGSGLQRNVPNGGRGVRLTMDGFPLNFADGSYDFLDLVDPLLVRDVTVWRGGNALAVGALTLGGAIEFTSYAPSEGPNLVRAQIGPDGFHQGALRLHATRGDVAASVSLTAFGQEGFRPYSAQEGAHAQIALSWPLGSAWQSTFTAMGGYSRAELPGPQTLAAVRARDYAADPFNVLVQIERANESYRVTERLVRELPEGSLSFGAAWAHGDADFVTDEVTDDFYLDAIWLNDQSLAGHDNHLKLGVEFVEGERTTEQAPFFGPPALFFNNRSTARSLVAYAENHWAWTDELTLVTGLQAARIARGTTDQIGTASGELDFTELNPRLGLLWQTTPATQLFANLTRSAEPPDWNALVFAPSGPPQVIYAPQDVQTAWTLEIGTRGQRGTLHWDVTAYASRGRDELLTQSTGAGTTFVLGNADRTVHRGVEAALAWDIGAGWSARQTWTWTYLHFQDDPAWGNNQFRAIPEHFLQTELRWQQPGGGWHAGANLTWQPEGAWTDYANTFRGEAFAVVDLNLGYQSPRGWSVFAQLRNATDEAFAASIIGFGVNNAGQDSANFVPGAPRSVYLGTAWKW